MDFFSIFLSAERFTNPKHQRESNMINYSQRLLIFSGSSHREFALEVCECLDIPLSNIDFVTFSNDNIKAVVKENVREADVFFIQTACTPGLSNYILETLISLDALKYASAARITAVLPYFPYVRSDKKDEPRISISARLMGDLLETAGASRILAMDLHSPQIQGFFNIPTDQLVGGNVICEYFREIGLKNSIVVATDAGSAKRAGWFAKNLKMNLAILDKRRHDDTEQPEIFNVIGDIEGKNCIIFDDEIATGASIIRASQAIKEKGAQDIYVGVVHPVFTKDAYEKIEDSTITKLVTTNSLPLKNRSKKIVQLSVAPLFAKAIKCIHNGESISRLFQKSISFKAISLQI